MDSEVSSCDYPHVFLHPTFFKAPPIVQFFVFSFKYHSSSVLQWPLSNPSPILTTIELGYLQLRPSLYVATFKDGESSPSLHQKELV